MLQDFQDDIEAVAGIASVPLILDVICRSTGMGFAAVARVTEDRWVCLASKDHIQFGLPPGGELDVRSTICDEIRQSRKPVVIDHVESDAAYCQHHTPLRYGFQSYISVPILLADGTFYGTLCAIDPKPARLVSSGAVDTFRLYAELIAAHLDTAQRALRAEQGLLDARAAAELREQFIAVLGHDLRNPLNAFAAGLALLRDGAPAGDNASSVLPRMQRSLARMVKLIDDVTDFTRGRLGGGMLLERTSEAIEPTLRHVVDELRAAHPGTPIELDVAVSCPVDIDRSRLAQLLSNLLANALTHGKKGAPVRIRASAADDFTLSVSNEGPEIAADTLPKLFAPFARGADNTERKGLGLGLFIASEIARAHGGVLEAESTAALTRFTFRMPLPADER